MTQSQNMGVFRFTKKMLQVKIKCSQIDTCFFLSIHFIVNEFILVSFLSSYFIKVMLRKGQPDYGHYVLCFGDHGNVRNL